MKTLFLTRYGRLGSSSRVRALQYIPFFEAMGRACDVSPLFSDLYVQALYGGTVRAAHVLRGYFRRLTLLVHLQRYDLVWVEKEIYPFLPASAERLLTARGVPFVADYDDAWFHRYDSHREFIVRAALGKKIDIVMRNATLVVAGNEYLANRARLAGARRVEIVPSVVDVDHYEITPRRSGQVVLGWIGSPSTAKYLHHIAEPLAIVQRRYDIRVRLVGSGPITLAGVQVEIVPWTEEREAELVASFDVGMMPLPDERFERGKCGYKLVQYMAGAKPVIASPVGVNVDIVGASGGGILAASKADWEDGLDRLIRDASLRNEMGLRGRALVERNYALHVQAPRLAELLTAAARQRVQPTSKSTPQR